jgi:hypothetical protein
MSNTAAVWLVIATGGRWSAAELEREGVYQGANLHSDLKSLERSGCIRRFEGKPITFGVTPECRIPHGITISAAMEAVGKAIA